MVAAERQRAANVVRLKEARVPIWTRALAPGLSIVLFSCSQTKLAPALPKLAYDCPAGAPSSPLPTPDATCAVLDFVTVDVGTTVERSIRLADLGRPKLDLTGSSLTPVSGGTFSVAEALGTIDVAKAATIDVSFAPAGVGPASATWWCSRTRRGRARRSASRSIPPRCRR
jgi:hypothetical protein